MKTQAVYVPTKQELSIVYDKSKPLIDALNEIGEHDMLNSERLLNTIFYETEKELVSNKILLRTEAILLTHEELKKIIGEAFDAGQRFSEESFDIEFSNFSNDGEPDKEQYINSLNIN